MKSISCLTIVAAVGGLASIATAATPSPMSDGVKATAADRQLLVDPTPRSLAQMSSERVAIPVEGSAARFSVEWFRNAARSSEFAASRSAVGDEYFVIANPLGVTSGTGSTFVLGGYQDVPSTRTFQGGDPTFDGPGIIDGLRGTLQYDVIETQAIDPLTGDTTIIVSIVSAAGTELIPQALGDLDGIIGPGPADGIEDFYQGTFFELGSNENSVFDGSVPSLTGPDGEDPFAPSFPTPNPADTGDAATAAEYETVTLEHGLGSGNAVVVDTDTASNFGFTFAGEVLRANILQSDSLVITAADTAYAGLDGPFGLAFSAATLDLNADPADIIFFLDPAAPQYDPATLPDETQQVNSIAAFTFGLIGDPAFPAGLQNLGIGAWTSATTIDRDPSVPTFGDGVCCVNGVSSLETRDDCLNVLNGTFFGIGTELVDINCVDCPDIALDASAGVETFAFGGVSDDTSGNPDGFNPGCLVAAGTEAFTPYDSGEQVGLTTPSSGTPAKIQGSLFTVPSISGDPNEFVNDRDSYVIIPDDGDGTAGETLTMTITFGAEEPITLGVLAAPAAFVPNAPSAFGGFLPDNAADGCTGLSLAGVAEAGGALEACTNTLEVEVVEGQQYFLDVQRQTTEGQGLGEGFSQLLYGQDVGTALDNVGAVDYEFEVAYADSTGGGGPTGSGACFLATGCIDTTASDCATQGGVFIGDGTACSDTDIPASCDPWAGGSDTEGESEFCDPANNNNTSGPVTGLLNDVITEACVAGVAQITGGSAIAADTVENGETFLALYPDPITGVTLAQRDIDHWVFNHTGGDLEVVFQAQHTVAIDILSYDCVTDPNADPAPTFIEFGDAFELGGVNNLDFGGAAIDECDVLGITITDADPGTYVIRISNDFDGETQCLEDNGEFLSRYSLVVNPVTCQDCPDVNGDGAVTPLDISAVLGAFGQSGLAPGTGGDTNCDGAVTPLDISNVLGAFGQSGLTCSNVTP